MSSPNPFMRRYTSWCSGPNDENVHQIELASLCPDCWQVLATVVEMVGPFHTKFEAWASAGAKMAAAVRTVGCDCNRLDLGAV